mmetsp:Transcript_99911/g.183201  ORF Transcript_99911/g.183201 Transcript_99911/m.183201 type:complete len:735 (+) Transcript_99911:92-2296(+)
MLARATATLGASSLLLLQFVAWSAQVGHDNGDLLVESEDAQPELHMLQLNAHLVRNDDAEGAAGNASSGEFTSGDIEGLKGKLASMQREMDEQRRLFQQLIADSAKPSVSAGSSSHRAQHSGRKQKNHSSQLADQNPPPNWGGDRMNLLPTLSPMRETIAPTVPPWEERESQVSNWPMPETQKEWLKRLKFEEPERAAEIREHFKEKQMEIKEAKVVACVLTSVIIVFCLAHIMQDFEIQFLPEGVMVVAVGFALGYTLKYYCGARIMFDDEFRAEIAIQLLNAVFLPMLMLEAGWGVRRMDFISQLPYILNFAVLGTLISTGVIAMLIYFTGQSGLHSIESLRGAFVIAALISATDPVSTLGTYSELKVDPLLNIIVFGEAAINDAVAIVVFCLVNDDYLMESFDNNAQMVAFGCYKGLKTLTCSFLLGALVSTGICMTLKNVGLNRNKKLEILVVVLGGYLSFSVGEYFKVSGIICTLFNGMFMGKYSKAHLSKEGSLLTTFFIKQMSTLMDAGVFLLSGVCCVCLDVTSADMGFLLMAFCAVARVFSTIPCGILSNWQKREFKRNPNSTAADEHILTPRYLFMIWHAGLRGGIAENLSMQIGTWINELEGPQAKEAVRSSVFLVVAAYVLIFGGTTQLFLKMLKIPMGADFKEDALSATESGMEDWRLASWLHFSVFKPLLVGEEAELENDDINYGDTEGKDVEEILKDVCHVHRGGTVPRKNAAAQLQAD